MILKSSPITHILQSRDETVKKPLNSNFLQETTAYVRNYPHAPTNKRSRDSVVGIAIGYGLDDRGLGVRVLVGPRIFSFPRRPDRLWVTQTPI
jgi:hypothetical protein